MKCGKKYHKKAFSLVSLTSTVLIAVFIAIVGISAKKIINKATEVAISVKNNQLYTGDAAAEIVINPINCSEVTITGANYGENTNSNTCVIFLKNDGSSQTNYTVAVTGDFKMDILMVGGGGGGGPKNAGGGGGAGGLVFYPEFNISSQDIITFKVGKGGAPAQTGQDSTFTYNSSTISALGGGCGYPSNLGSVSACDGGSGGGVRHYTNGSPGSSIQNSGVAGVWVGYGNDGGGVDGVYSGAGGGGAGEAGSNSGNPANGDFSHGGDGIAVASLNSMDYDFADIFGIISGIGQASSGSVYFAGGGGGGGGQYNGDTLSGDGGLGGGGKGSDPTFSISSVPGADNTGGGGGAGASGGTDGASGGSGVVLLRFYQ